MKAMTGMTREKISKFRWLALFAVALAGGHATANASEKDKIIFDDATVQVPAGFYADYEVLIHLPDGVVSSEDDGSMDPASFKDKAAGSAEVTNLDGEPAYFKDGRLIQPTPRKHVCLSVEGNQAVLWWVFTETHEPECSAGDLGLAVYVDNGDGTGTAKAINATKLLDIRDLESCSQNDADIVNKAFDGMPGLPLTGIKVKDGAIAK